jgi:BirA family biotin operon repressor/biotin-[acetyl-CoA-carboxylase] ligase
VLIYTDNVEFISQFFPSRPADWATSPSIPNKAVGRLVERLLGDRTVYASEAPSAASWTHLVAAETAPRSQYDVLVSLGQQGTGLPDGVLCLAGTGHGFHGFHARPWSVSAGNIHLSVRVTPPPRAGRPPVCFIALAAVSVVDAIDATPGLERQAGIKWVNDILIEDAKVCGILAHTEGLTRGISAAVMGIGLNVETTPTVPPTPFVPRVGSLREFMPDPAGCSVGRALAALLAALDRNYQRLASGDDAGVLRRYRDRSIVVGREVAVCSEQSGSNPVARGRVIGLGEHLELLIEGHERPFFSGRLVLDPANAGPDTIGNSTA